MAGTNHTQESTTPRPPAPAIILVRPQLGENIGMCARAMLNCGVTDLRIVAPRDGWPNTAALSASAGAVEVIKNAQVFSTTGEAVSDLEAIYATTARNRAIAKNILTAEEAGQDIHARHTRSGQTTCGLLFGPERTGLENDEIALASHLVTIPLNPAFSSLNLAQAVLLLCYAWLSAENPYDRNRKQNETLHQPAPHSMTEAFVNQLEESLDKAGFFRSEGHRPHILRNLRNYFFRSMPTEQEVRTLYGIIAALSGRRNKDK